jgi:glycosyltransferase involved in cell wall biosynthesis
LLLHRSDAKSLVGGPNEQVRQHAQAVTEAGGEAVVHFSHEQPAGRFDVAHLMNVDWPLETARQLDIALRSADRVVLTPIHHRRSWEDDYHCNGRHGLSRSVARVTGLDGFVRLRGVFQARNAPRLRAEAARQLAGGIAERQRRVLDRSETWLVSCEREMESIVQDFGVAPKPARIVPSGADWIDDDVALPVLPDEFVLCVARIEARKNQLALARALVELGVPGVFVGDPNPRHRAFVRRFASYVGEHRSLMWLRGLSREQCLAMYRRAGMHALASWYEVQPLVDCEAAVAGCPILTTSRSYSREVLGGAAEYWDPASGHAGLVEGVRTTLDRAREWADPHRFREHLSWARTRRELAPAYGL